MERGRLPIVSRAYATIIAYYINVYIPMHNSYTELQQSKRYTINGVPDDLILLAQPTKVASREIYCSRSDAHTTGDAKSLEPLYAAVR
jgi:hypothetical protein